MNDYSAIERLKTRGKVLAITVGLPASGKTTWALSAGFDQTVSLDDCREMLWGNRTLQDGPGGIPALLLAQKARISAAMARNQSIVAHNTNLLKAHRIPLVEIARLRGYRSLIIYFDVSREECLRRNRLRDDAVPDAIIDEYAARLEVPEDDEADVVMRYSEISGFQVHGYGPIETVNP